MEHVVERVRGGVHRRWIRYLLNRQMLTARLDPRIHYPCYKSLDAYFDVERLKGLDAELQEYILARSRATRDEAFDAGELTMRPKLKRYPGSRVIYLAHSTRGFKYFDLDDPGLWVRTPEAAELPRLMEFIDAMPFKAKARMMIMYDMNGGAVTPHRDHYVYKKCHEFIWFRTNLRKPFYMLDPRTGKKSYVESYTAWFDTVNQFHGADPVEGLSFSLRVDGAWTDEFRRLIPTPARNAASTPSLWACTSGS